MQPRRIALLALLACYPHNTLAREKLIAFLWPEADESHGRHRLSESLYVLRRSLGEETLLSEGDQVRLNPDRVDCDLVSFRQALENRDMKTAVSLYNGPLLDGFFLKDAEEFHRWLESERQGLAEAYARALEALAIVSVQNGDAQEGVGWWSRLTAHDPYNSRFALGLMQALVRAGDPGNAIHHAREHVLLLREELGIEPPSDILGYAESLRNGEEHAPIGGAYGWEVSGGGAAPRVRRQPQSDSEPKAGPPAPSPGTPKRSRRLRTAATLAFSIVLGAGAVYTSLDRTSAPSFIPDLVIALPFENRTGDPALDDAALLAGFWVEEALQQVDGVRLMPSSLARYSSSVPEADGPWRLNHAGTQGANAAWTIRGAIRERGDDSLEVRVEVIDRSHTTREQHVVEASVRDSLLITLDRVARRASGALAYEFDPLMEETEEGSQPLPSPPTIEAFREHRRGYQAMDQGDPGAAFRHHLAAYALDTTLVRAIVAAAYMTGDYHVKDSLARFARERQHLLSRRGQLDLRLLTAMVASDHEGALRAIRESARLDFDGYSRIAQAFFAMRVNLPGEALAATSRYDPDLEWRRSDSHFYWRRRTEALHMLGRFQEELAEARAGRARFPTHLHLLIAEARALAALGQEKEVSDLLQEARSLPQTHDSVAVVAATELRAHGHLEASRRVFDRATDWLKGSLEEGRDDSTSQFYLARALYGAERWSEAQQVAGSLLVRHPDHLPVLGLAGCTAARLGDSTLAQEIMDRLSGMARPYEPGEHLYQMASIAAVSGRPDEAMRLLYRAYAEGVPHGLRLHQDMNFEPLRAREDFLALVSPKG